MENKIFGYEFEQILAMQQGKHIPKSLPSHCQKPEAKQSDKSLLELHGLEKLKEMGFYGVIDRLKNSGLIA